MFDADKIDYPNQVFLRVCRSLDQAEELAEQWRSKGAYCEVHTHASFALFDQAFREFLSLLDE